VDVDLCEDDVDATHVLPARVDEFLASSTATGQISDRLHASVLSEAQQLLCSYRDRSSSSTAGSSRRSDLWSDAFSPTTMRDVAAHLPSVALVRQWLQGWKAGAKDALSSPASSQKRAKRGRTTADDADDSDDVAFPAFAPLTPPRPVSTYSALALRGPHGTGKTMCVHMLCAELGLRVIEVNPSSRRTGRSVLHLFKEATQSYGLLTREATAKECREDGPHNVISDNGAEQQTPAKKPKKEEQQASKATNVIIIEDAKPQPAGPKLPRQLALFSKRPVPEAAPAGPAPAPTSTPRAPHRTAEANGPREPAERPRAVAAFFCPRVRQSLDPNLPRAPTPAEKQGPQTRSAAKRKTMDPPPLPEPEAPAVTWCDLGAWGGPQEPGLQDNTVVLFDEADVAFADEPGFLAAVKQLIDDNKCPVILTSTSTLTALEDDENVFEVVFDEFEPSPSVTMVPRHVFGGEKPRSPLTEPTKSPVSNGRTKSPAKPEFSDPSGPSQSLPHLGAAFRLQLLMLAHGMDVPLRAMQTLLLLYGHDLRRVLNQLQWLALRPLSRPFGLISSSHMSPLAQESSPGTHAPAPNILEDGLGVRSWADWWTELLACTTNPITASAVVDDPPLTTTQSPWFRKISSMTRGMAQDPTATFLGDCDVAFQNWPSIVPGTLTESSSANPTEGLVNEPARPPAKESLDEDRGATAAEPSSIPTNQSAIATEASSSTHATEEAPKVLSQGGSDDVDTIVRAAAQAARRRAEEQRQQRRASFWAGSSQGNAGNFQFSSGEDTLENYKGILSGNGVFFDD